MFLVFFSTKTDVAKHESVTQKHLKSASHRTHTVVYTVAYAISLLMNYSIQIIKLRHYIKNEGNEA